MNSAVVLIVLVGTKPICANKLEDWIFSKSLVTPNKLISLDRAL